MNSISAQPVPVDIAGFRAEMQAADIEEIVPVTLDTYRAEAAAHRKRLDGAVGARDADAIATAAHAMKSAAAAIKAQALSELLRQLECAGKNDDLATALALADPVRGESDSVLEFLGRAAVTDYEI